MLELETITKTKDYAKWTVSLKDGNTKYSTDVYIDGEQSELKFSPSNLSNAQKAVASRLITEELENRSELCTSFCDEVFCPLSKAEW